MTKERNHHFDNIKAILIFCVVLGHVLKKFGMTEGADLLYKIIFSFHMPAFLFVSGYFAGRDIRKFFSKILPLYVIFQVIQLLERDVIQSLNAGQVSLYRFQIFTPLWTLWYLVALLILQLLLPLFDTDHKKKQKLYLLIALILGFAVGFLPDTRNFLAMSRVFVFLPFYMWGYYEKKNQTFLRFCREEHPGFSKGLSVFLGIGLIFVFVVFQSSIQARWFYGTEHYSDFGMMYGRVFGWLTAFLWIFILLSVVPEKRILVMDQIGQNTLPVYLLHSLTILVLLQTPLRDCMQGNLWMLILLSVLMTLLLSWNGFEKLLRKIKIPYKK